MNKIFLIHYFLVLMLQSGYMYGQDSSRVSPGSSLQHTMVAGDEADVVEPKRKLIKWNEFEGKFISIKLGGGFLVDGALFVQDKESEKQVPLEPDAKIRDWRFIFKGRLGRKAANQPVTYTMGIMYDVPNNKWLFRETGIMLAAPRLFGNVFIGRTKEGFSLNKVMVGYAGWTMERSAMSDATVPILGDGIKWLGYLPNRKLLWNIGYFFDKFNYNQAFSSYDRQGVARLVYLPVLSDTTRTVFHVGVNLRKGSVDNDTLQLRSRPEVYPAPFFVDTKKFFATQTFMYGGEIYYRKGPWLIGTEYWFQDVSSQPNGNPVFQGGEVVLTWLVTGETREYNTVGGFFKGIIPGKTIFEGGPGAIELVLRTSYIDLDDEKIRGGKFWRITPMINWHMSDNIRLELAYGLGKLNRFGTIGDTHFFQSRIQFQL